ncbi:hypothetical protein EDB92DRAFT_1943017 [Lactarius akahatsu]|uniref:Uncharacterized protein n=1 Tax=Lactarius akahatsu TaxID=416441 RepID=A0AAD4LR46_9AGAM|nr:hypothetical protein EDB92DRAFT_1943017 [Lactarius akahatsu]
MDFTKNGLRGVCIFTGLPGAGHPSKGLRLSSLGIFLARSLCPRPWRHVPVLKALVRDLHSNSAALRDSSKDVWAPARRFFELRKARLADLALGQEDGNGYEPRVFARFPNAAPPPPSARPGPSSLTLYKHVLCNQRIRIYTQMPVEPACFLC